MNQWYYSTNGKAQGPVSTEFLIENLRKGQMTLVDLVFRPGDVGWVTVGEIPEFREAYNALPLNPPQSLPPLPTQVIVTADETSGESANQNANSTKQPFEIGAFKKMISLSDSHSVQPLAMPQSGWPRDWQLSTSWIVLKKRQDGSGFDQDGPFSAEQIIEMIGQGKVEYSQYCWKPGYTRWFRIGNLPEFDRRKRDRDNDTVNQIVPVPEIREALPALTREELLAGIERLKQNRKAQEASAPSETDGRDLTRNAIDVTPIQVPKQVTAQAVPQTAAQPAVQHASQPQAAQPAPQPQAPQAREQAQIAAPIQTPAWNIPQVQRPIAGQEEPAQAAAFAALQTASSEARRVPKRVMRLGVAGGVAGLVVIGLLQYASHKDADVEVSQKPRSPAAKQTEPKDNSVENKDAELPAETSRGGNGANAPVAAPPAQAQNPGTTLEIVPLKLTTAPSLTFQTDASPGQVISVKLTAKTGEVLRFGSYSNSFEVTRSNGEVPTLDLSNLDLPPGTYTVSASVGAATANTQVFIGVKGPEFLSQLERHIKGLSYRQQAEKKALFYGSQKLAGLAETLVTKGQALKGQPKTWKKELALWRAAAKEAAMPVLQFAATPKNESAFPEQLAIFQAAVEKLAAQANEIDSAMEQKRDIASSDLESTIAALNEIRDEAGRLSGRPQQANAQ